MHARSIGTWFEMLATCMGSEGPFTAEKKPGASFSPIDKTEEWSNQALTSGEWLRVLTTEYTLLNF